MKWNFIYYVTNNLKKNFNNKFQKVRELRNVRNICMKTEKVYNSEESRSVSIRAMRGKCAQNDAFRFEMNGFTHTYPPRTLAPHD